MTPTTEPTTAARTVTLTIDGKQVEVPEGTTIWEAARDAGVDIPVLCHDERMEPVGVCRMCVVDTGGRVMAASCVRPCEDGMEVDASSDKVRSRRKVLTELMMSDHPTPCERERETGDCDLEALARDLGVGSNGLPRSPGADRAADNPVHKGEGVTRVESRNNGRRPVDLSSPVIHVDHQACILCDKCIRGCDDVQNNHVIGRTGKGYESRIVFDTDKPMGESTCVACGECVAACPTGALTNAPITLDMEPAEDLKTVDSVCPYCGVGCAVSLHVEEDDNQVVWVDGRDGETNKERLCVKGRYGFDYATHKHRLTKPLIRKESSYPKGPLSTETLTDHGHRRKPGGVVDYEEVLPHFREATWEEALGVAAERLGAIRDEHGGGALAGFGSAKCSNEEAYLFQKLIRAVWGTNNVDHCTRLCHASSVAALLETIGSGAVSTTFRDVRNSDVALITGSNTTSNHPVAATFIKEAVRSGRTKLIVIDPKRTGIADFADEFVHLKSGTDVGFYNAVMHCLVRDDNLDEDYIAERTENFDELKALVADWTPDRAAELCGVDADQIERVAALIGSTAGPEGAMLVFWGMGISQHTTGTDNARCLISIMLMTGNVGRQGTGLHPLRGQNNVQGASDAGLIPIVYPDYQSVTDPDVRAKFEKAWGTELDPDTGLTVVEIMHGALEDEIRGMYIQGENPFMSDPNQNKVRAALSNLDFLVVADIFLTETAEFADVILPATSYFEKTGTYTNSDRRVQIGRTALEAPGEAREDWRITVDLANRMGAGWEYDTVEDVFREFADLTESYKYMDYDKLGDKGLLWPMTGPDDKTGVEVLFSEEFPSGRGKFVPCEFKPAVEQPDSEYPLVLNTGRLLEHWHTSTMTRRSKALNAIQPTAFCRLHPKDADRLGLEEGDMARVSSRRGAIELEVRVSDRVREGAIFIPFHFREAAANALTIDALDPWGKIPEYKFCAVKAEKVDGAETR